MSQCSSEQFSKTLIVPVKRTKESVENEQKLIVPKLVSQNSHRLPASHCSDGKNLTEAGCVRKHKQGQSKRKLTPIPEYKLSATSEFLSESWLPSAKSSPLESSVKNLIGFQLFYTSSMRIITFVQSNELLVKTMIDTSQRNLTEPRVHTT